MARQNLDALASRLRDHLIGALHLGELEAGERLPSIREVARELGENQRRVARAYGVLAAEGLVEVRGRSGVFAAPQARLGDGMLEETAEWFAGVFLEGWKRRIAPRDLARRARDCASRTRIRCAFVDSCEDVIVAFGHELREEFGFEVTPVSLGALRAAEQACRNDSSKYPDALRRADVLVTTVFSATSVRRLAQKLDKPAIVVTVHPMAAATVIGHLAKKPLTVICADPSFGDRLRVQYEEHIGSEEQLRIVLADDAEAVARVDRSEPILLTRAARKRLGALDLKLLIPHSPTLSPASAAELTRLLVWANTEASAAPPRPVPNRQER